VPRDTKTGLSTSMAGTSYTRKIRTFPTGRSFALACMLALAALHALTPYVAGALRPQACRSWERRALKVDKLPGEELVELRKNTKVLQTPLWSAAPFNYGVSLPGNLVVISPTGGLKGRDPLLWHEMAHQYQYKRDGSLVFIKSYVSDWYRGLLAGCGPTRSYRAIGYELEVHEMLKDTRIALGGLHSAEFKRVATLLYDPNGN